MVNEQIAGNTLTLVFEKSKLLLLPTFVSFRKFLFLANFASQIVSMGFFQNFAREIGARATRIYAFAHARGFHRGEPAVKEKHQQRAEVLRLLFIVF